MAWERPGQSADEPTSRPNARGRSPGVVQLTTFADMRASLIANSQERRTNRDFLAILSDLEAAGGKESAAISSKDHEDLAQDDITALLERIPAARSTHRSVPKQQARNQALTELHNALSEKRTWAEARAEALDRISVERMASQSDAAGAKAGFEMETPNVYAFDLAKCTAFERRELEQGRLPSLVTPHFHKRDFLFWFPDGTWEGQADSTLEGKSNLEIVTKALTANEWEGEAAASGQVQLIAFVARLNGAPTQRLLIPTELEPGLRMVTAGLRLFKQVSPPAFQGQMTAGRPMKSTDSEQPAWWLDGMNWGAVPYLKDIARALNSPGELGKNPKEAFQGTILKTPLLHILGRPSGLLTEQHRREWLRGMASQCKVNLADKVAHKLVEMTKRSPKRKAFLLDPTNFTWEDYLLDLLNGTDRVTDWASAAFRGEDMGLGKIDDPTLPDGYVIEERRRFKAGEEPSPDNYVRLAQTWAEGSALHASHVPAGRALAGPSSIASSSSSSSYSSIAPLVDASERERRDPRLDGPAWECKEEEPPLRLESRS